MSRCLSCAASFTGKPTSQDFLGGFSNSMNRGARYRNEEEPEIARVGGSGAWLRRAFVQSSPGGRPRTLSKRRFSSITSSAKALASFSSLIRAQRVFTISFSCSVMHFLDARTPPSSGKASPIGVKTFCFKLQTDQIAVPPVNAVEPTTVCRASHECHRLCNAYIPNSFHVASAT